MNSNTRLSGILSAVGLAVVILWAPSAHSDGPDYEGTIAYIQSGLSDTLTERNHCSFHAKHAASGSEHLFSAGDLDVVPVAITSSEIRFMCPEGTHCVTALSESPTDKTEINFSVHSDAHGIALGVSRLIEMCSGGLH